MNKQQLFRADGRALRYRADFSPSNLSELLAIAKEVHQLSHTDKKYFSYIHEDKKGHRDFIASFVGAKSSSASGHGKSLMKYSKDYQLGPGVAKFNALLSLCKKLRELDEAGENLRYTIDTQYREGAKLTHSVTVSGVTASYEVPFSQAKWEAEQKRLEEEATSNNTIATINADTEAKNKGAAEDAENAANLILQAAQLTNDAAVLDNETATINADTEAKNAATAQGKSLRTLGVAAVGVAAVTALIVLVSKLRRK